VVLAEDRDGINHERYLYAIKSLLLRICKMQENV